MVKQKQTASRHSVTSYSSSLFGGPSFESTFRTFRGVVKNMRDGNPCTLKDATKCQAKMFDLFTKTFDTRNEARKVYLKKILSELDASVQEFGPDSKNSGILKLVCSYPIRLKLKDF